ncbi:hypothetical protein EI555_012012 [Monodon monoceros]|uniref:Cytochrome c oxidase subunit 3 n=1 Tax=Monodon monoceros TaxID=40151 RepID=A0A4U1FBH3_MONMO|nr:hypothetical protein EI555_012012 [Monodon monoceros]
MSRYRGYRSPQQNKSISSSLPTIRHAHPPHPHASNYRNYQPIHPTGSTSCATNGQYYSRSFIHTSNRRGNFSANKQQHIHGSHYVHYSHPTHYPRIRRRYNSSLSPFSPPHNIRPTHMIPLQLNNSTNTRSTNQHSNNTSVMTSCYLTKHCPRPPHTNRPKGTSIRNNLIYCLRTFYHSNLTPTPELGGCWPPTGIRPLNPLEVLLLNTSVLLASGVSITWAHHSLMEGNRKHTLQALFITITLGVYILHSYKPQSITKPHLRSQMGSMDRLSLWLQDSTDYICCMIIPLCVYLLMRLIVRLVLISATDFQSISFGLLIYQSHLMSSQLCLKGIILSLCILAALAILNSHFTLASIIPIILLVFAACEPALGLALLVVVSNTYGTDYPTISLTSLLLLNQFNDNSPNFSLIFFSDSLSALLLILTIQSHLLKEPLIRKKLYITILIILQTFLIITFTATERILFYIIFEATLVPTLIIITSFNAGLYFWITPTASGISIYTKHHGLSEFSSTSVLSPATIQLLHQCLYMTGLHDSLCSKSTPLRPPPLTTQSTRRGSHCRFYSPRSRITKTRGLQRATNHINTQHPNRIQSIPFPHALSMRNNHNQFYLSTSNRPKITHCLLFRQPHGTPSLTNLALPPTINLIGELFIVISTFSGSNLTIILIGTNIVITALYSMYILITAQRGKGTHHINNIMPSFTRQNVLLALHILPLLLLSLNPKIILGPLYCKYSLKKTLDVTLLILIIPIIMTNTNFYKIDKYPSYLQNKLLLNNICTSSIVYDMVYHRILNTIHTFRPYVNQFFKYLLLFLITILILVTANNLFQLFIGTCISRSRKISSIWTSPLTPLSNTRSHPRNSPTPLKHNMHSRENNKLIQKITLCLGALTTLFTAVHALTQNDIKKITSSQLGLMIVTTGINQPYLAFLHICSHAFFKAILFMCSRSIIHNLNNEQDIQKIGGLFKTLPFTATAIIIGSAFLTGFYSKDLIIETANTPINNSVTSLTAIYSTLIIFFALPGQPHSSPSAPISENNPLLISCIKRLLIGSIFAGFVISNSILPTTIPLITIPLHFKLTALIVTTLGFVLALEVNPNTQNIPTPQAPLNSLLS